MRLSEWLLAKSLIERLQKKKGVVLRIAPFFVFKARSARFYRCACFY
jgi:hypothetical protein